MGDVVEHLDGIFSPSTRAVTDDSPNAGPHVPTEMLVALKSSLYNLIDDDPIVAIRWNDNSLTTMKVCMTHQDAINPGNFPPDVSAIIHSTDQLQWRPL